MLLNSGLKFPLNEQADRHLYQLRATEHCDVLYSNEALFVDTPGAYTESRPDSPAHKVWTALLRALFKVRPARPLNGIIVCVSMRDIIDNDAPRREHLARTIRQRLSEALKRLRTYVPVYLVFTKCDAVPGFAQFFAHLSRAEREQIFGCPAKSDVMEAGSVRSELKDLMQTLNAQIVTKSIRNGTSPRAAKCSAFRRNWRPWVRAWRSSSPRPSVPRVITVRSCSGDFSFPARFRPRTSWPPRLGKEN